MVDSSVSVTASAAQAAVTPRREDDICVILNTRSGKKRQEVARELERLFAAHSGRVDIRSLNSGREVDGAARAAVEEGFGTIVAAGGDGTICGIAARVAGSDSRFGVLPLGTFNYFARSLDLPEELEAAVDVVRRGDERGMGLGEVNGAAFLNNASIGAYAMILQRRERIYQRWGRSRIAAYWSVVTTLLRLRSSQRMQVSVDGETRTLRSPLIFIAANAFQLEVFNLPGGDCVEEGKFALFVAPDRTGPALLAYAFRLAFRGMQEGRDFTLLRGQEIVIDTARKRMLVARDGEKARMTGPFTFRYHRDALRVIVPRATGESEAE